MPAHVKSAALHGIDAIQVDIEVDVLPGLPSFVVVGLGDKAIQESRERLTAALSNLDFTPPRRKTIVSLAPASLKKEGSIYDLPITLAFLIASKQIKTDLSKIANAWFIGELGLDGTIRPVKGVLPIVLAAVKSGLESIYIPGGNAEEASSLADKIDIYPANSLQEIISHLPDEESKTSEKFNLTPLSAQKFPSTFPQPEVDFADIKGHDHAKRALLLAAASSHHILMVGPPGTGKTLLARALAGILPPLNRQESLVVTSLYSVAGLLPENSGLIRLRPFRSPHHGASSVALVGGGSHPKPGEVSLAHNGVLFLDELPEFSRHVLDQLRQPIEDGFITVSRASHTIKFPARCQVVAAMNPCKCGYYGSEQKDCTCGAGDIVRYQRRVSGPFLDRFDLHVLVSDIPIEKLLTDKSAGPTSKQLSQQAQAARQIALKRQGKPNSSLNARELKTHCLIDSNTKKLLYQAEKRFHISSRGVHRLLKVSRTIADLEDKSQIQPRHLSEALQYREQLTSALPEFV